MKRPTSGILSESYVRMHVILAGLCRNLTELVHPQRGDHFAAAGIVILADAGVEAAINHVVEAAFRHADILEKRTGASIVNVAYQAVTDTEPPLQRLKILAGVHGFPLDLGSEPWQSARDLHTIRNALAHFSGQPVASNYQESHAPSKVADIVRRRGWKEPHHGESWLDALITAGLGNWATETLKAVIEKLEDRAWYQAVWVE